MTEIEALAAPFRIPSAEDWRRLVEAALDGASLESLSSETREGLAVAPLYPQPRDARPLFARPSDGAWGIVQRLDHPDPAEANAQARRELERGATGLALVHEDAAAADGFGLPPGSESLRRLLDGLPLDRVILRVEPHPHGPTTALHLAKLIEARQLERPALQFAFGLDPIGVAAAQGGFAGDWPEIAADHVDIAEQLAEFGFNGPVFEADGRIYAAAGADAVHELAAILAAAAAYLRLVDAYGAPPELQFKLIGVTLAVDADQLVSIAKLRAARLLWARMQEVCGAPRTRLRLHAETARLMMMRADPHTNLLRTTIAAFAAGVGGADSLTVLPFNIALGLPDAFARRLARNTQLLLIEESHLHRIADPAAGSGAVEAMTEELGRRAWAAFREIEREGGIVESLKAGRLQARLAAQREALVARLGVTGLVGLTHYIDGKPMPVKVAQLPPRGRDGRRQPAVPFEPLAPLDLETRVSRVPESAP
ncbi:MAG TPA: methylmalonyl-CoA mutase family protein [Afifellaceae bacterium]|nr:methylmalonyl-CoA mutase family protein [Afifellaceae bacterium]